jgi:hypothetical protein
MAKVVRSSSILVTLMVEALQTPESSVFTRAARRNILEVGILNVLVKSYVPECTFASIPDPNTLVSGSVHG